MQFPDGQLPSKEIIKKWLALVDDFFSEQYSGAPTGSVETKAEAPESVHDKHGKKKSSE